MIEKQSLDPEERILTLNDVKQLYMASRRRMIKWALLGAVFAFLFVGIRAPKYKIEATFKEGLEKSDSGGAVRELLSGVAGAHQPQAASFMKSFQVLKPLVEKIGLQVSPQKSGWIVKKVFKRYRDSLKATKGIPLDDLDPFVFQNVLYEGEKNFGFAMVFTDCDHFVIQTPDRKMDLGKGTLGTEVNLQEFPVKFTVMKTPTALKMGFSYPFSIGSWVGPARSLRGDLHIINDKNNKAIYDLTIFNRDRHLGMRILNELMVQYQCYLKREHDDLAKEHLTYFENKQKQLYGTLDALLGENVAYLTDKIGKNGVISLMQESQGLLLPHQLMQQKILSIDMEFARLEGTEKEGKAIACAEDSPFAKVIQQLAGKTHELKQQRDLLELALCRSAEPFPELRRDELKEIRNQRFAIEKLIQEVDLGQEISSLDLNPALSLWATALQDPEEKEDFAEYLENYSRLLSMREKILQDRFFYEDNGRSELEGIDLFTARELFVTYNIKLDAAEASMRHYEQFKKEIHDPHFELASLSVVLLDPLSQKLIGEANEASLRLKDEKYHSSKEGERYEEQILLQKKILSGHLDQLSKVEELNTLLIREKMRDLQTISLDGINQQIAVLHAQTKDAVTERKIILAQEKQLLEQKMVELRASATSLPEKWRFEKWLDIKTEMVKRMMETITEVVESKTIAHHLHHVESKPLDRALLPGLPENPRLYMMTFLGAFSFAFGSFCLSMIRQLLKGFPITLEKLRVLRLPVLGSISSFCDGPSLEIPTGPDLELLRRLSLFTQGGKMIGLFGGYGPDYSFALVENLARMSTKSILLRCDFLAKFRKGDCPGLLQVWKEEVGEIPMRKGNGFDYMTAGGYSPFGTEIIQSQKFIQLVELLKKNYDLVFLFFRTPLASAESIAALQLCDKAVVTISGEQTEELTPFITWGYHEDRCRLTFIAKS